MNRGKLMNTLSEIIERSGLYLLGLFISLYLILFGMVGNEAIADQQEQIARSNSYLHLTVNDKPLLNDAQINQIKQTDSVTLDLGNKYVVIQSEAREVLKGYY